MVQHRPGGDARSLNPDIKLRARTAGSMVTIPATLRLLEAKTFPTRVEINCTVRACWRSRARLHLHATGLHQDKSKNTRPLSAHGRNGPPALTQRLCQLHHGQPAGREEVVPMMCHAGPTLAVRRLDADNNDALENYLLKDLIPVRQVPGADQRQSRALFGLSMGGAAALPPACAIWSCSARSGRTARRAPVRLTSASPRLEKRRPNHQLKLL